MSKRRAFLFAVPALSLLELQFANGAPAVRIAIGLDPSRSLGTDGTDHLTDRLTAGLINSGKYEIVDRARLSAALREQGLSNSPYADPKTAAALGKLVGAQRLLHVTSITAEDDTEAGAFLVTHKVIVSASFQMVEVATARILLAGNAEGSGVKQTPSGASPLMSQLLRDAVNGCADDTSDQMTGLK
jgi:hypothetical protein